MVYTTWLSSRRFRVLPSLFFLRISGEDLLQNGDFASYGGTETGTVHQPVQSHHLIGWTIDGGVVRIKSGNSAWGSPPAVKGTYLTGLHAHGGGSIRQLVSGLQIGNSYTVSWYERDRAEFQARSLKVHVQSGAIISALHVVPDDWALNTGDFIATETNASIVFSTPGGSADGTVFLDDLRMRGIFSNFHLSSESRSFLASRLTLFYFPLFPAGVSLLARPSLFHFSPDNLEPPHFFLPNNLGGTCYPISLSESLVSSMIYS